MKAVKYMDEEVVIKKGVDLLVKILGPMEAIRFMLFSKERKIDSFKRHLAWQKKLKKLDKNLFLTRCSNRTESTMNAAINLYIDVPYIFSLH